MRDKDYYNNKNIFIVGGSSGIGLSTALLLVEKGANVCIFARREPLLKQALQQLKPLVQNNNKISYRCVDVVNETDVIDKFSNAADEIGSPDILINCAGAAFPNYFENITADQFESTLRLNVLGVRNVCFAILPFMKQTGGHIINTSSIAGFIGVFGYTDYSASKFAIVGFSEALQQEISQHDIRVSVLYPPDTLTAGFAEEEKTKPKETRAISGNAKILTAEQVASALVKQMPKQNFHIHPKFDGRLSHVLKRWTPSLVNWVMARSIRNS